MELTTLGVILLAIPNSMGIPGDPVMYLPPFEVRTMDSDSRPLFLPPADAQFQALNQNVMSPMQKQQQILHTSPVIPSTPAPPVTTEKPHDLKHQNFTINELVEALTGMAENKDEEQSRAVLREDYPPSAPPASYPSYPPYPSYPSSRPYGYPYTPRPTPHQPYPSSYHEPVPAAYLPPTAVHHTVSSKTLKPELLTGLLKPVTTKAAGKLSGLISLVLALFSGGDGLELKGFKDIIINGIIKPLLVAKGGIKSLISKLTIPVIALLLINVEVLITVWWLWEDCPEPVPVPLPPVYPYPKPAYNHNSYR